jgi:hypothetical protein
VEARIVDLLLLLTLIEPGSRHEVVPGPRASWWGPLRESVSDRLSETPKFRGRTPTRMVRTRPNSLATVVPTANGVLISTASHGLPNQLTRRSTVCRAVSRLDAALPRISQNFARMAEA